MNVWLSSDLHLGHRNIMKFEEGRAEAFKGVEDMDKQIIGRFNAEIGYGDKLILLGDLCMGTFEDSLARLGKLRSDIEVVLLPGNHDRWSLAYGHRGTHDEQVKKTLDYWKMYSDVLGSRGNVILDQIGGWYGQELGLSGDAAGWKFSHYPPEGESVSGREDRYNWLRPTADSAEVFVHGHVHSSWSENDNMFNVGVDVRGYQPVRLEEIETWAKTLK